MTDEFASLQQARRRVKERDPARAEALGLRLQELLRKLESPALAPLLQRRWCVLVSFLQRGSGLSPLDELAC